MKWRLFADYCICVAKDAVLHLASYGIVYIKLVENFTAPLLRVHFSLLTAFNFNEFFRYLVKSKMFVKNSKISIFFTLAMLVSPASALDKNQIIDALKSFGDGAEAQRLEDKVSSLIESGDQIGLEKLSDQIREKDGALLEAITAVAQSENKKDMTEIGLSMGSCHYANIAIRSIALMLFEERTKPVTRNGMIMIDGTEMDDYFALQMSRCVLTTKLPNYEPKIGSRCIMTGVGCNDDPDMK